MVHGYVHIDNNPIGRECDLELMRLPTSGEEQRSVYQSFLCKQKPHVLEMGSRNSERLTPVVNPESHLKLMSLQTRVMKC